MDISAIIFDFGGVMEPFVEASSFMEEEARMGLAPGSLTELLWASPEWRRAEVGAITDEEYWRRLGARLGMHTDQEIADFAWGLFGDVKADPCMVELIRGLRVKYRTGLLSNATDILPRLLREHYHLDGLFHVEIISAVVGLTKPNPAIYRLALEHLETEPEATVFIDNLEANVQAAATMGINAIQFIGYEALLPALERFGVTLPQ